MKFSKQILDLCKKAHNSKGRGMKQAKNTEPVMLSSYLKVNLQEEEMFIFSRDHVYIKQRAFCTERHGPRDRPPDSWPTGTLVLFSINKSKMRKDHQGWHQ